MKFVHLSFNALISLCIIAQSPLQFAQAREISSMKEMREVLANKQPVVIMFFAPWCGACNAMKEPFNKVAATFQKEAVCVKVNAEKDEFRDLVDMYGVEAIPTVIIRHVGIMDSDKLNGSIKSLLKQPTLQKHAAPVQEAKKENQPKPAKTDVKKSNGKPATTAKTTASKPSNKSAQGQQNPIKTIATSKKTAQNKTKQ